jgi:hypothetical protein
MLDFLARVFEGWMVTADGTLTFDESAWPLVVLVCPESLLKDSAISIAREFERILARKERFVLIVDTTPVKSVPDAAWRKSISDWANDPEIRRKTERLNVGTALIMPSPLSRGIYTALGWLWKPASPQHASPTMVDAVAYCCDMLVKAGVPRSRKLIELEQSLKIVPVARGRG